MKNSLETIGDILVGIAVLLAVGFVSFMLGYDKGHEKGYTDALDDIRMGKPAKYKLVQTAEKWVEVGE